MASLDYFVNSQGAGVNMLDQNFDVLFSYEFGSYTPTEIYTYNDSDNFFRFTGSGFRYVRNGAGEVTDVTAGTIDGAVNEAFGQTRFVYDNLNLSAAALFDAVFAGNDDAVLALITKGNDRVDGTEASDTLYGGAGVDTLIGRGGADLFVFRAATESTTAGRDLLTDLSLAQGDRIALGGIDADATRAGNQTFEFIGRAAFTGDAGELRFTFVDGDTIVSGDRNGDRAADFSLRLDDTYALTAGDFIL